jgi:hypothetical protein
MKCVSGNTFGRLAVLVLPAGQMLSRNNFFCAHGNCLSGQTVAGTGDSSAERGDEYTFALSRRSRQKTVSWRHENPDPQQNLVPERDSLHAQKMSSREDIYRDVQLVHKSSLRRDDCPPLRFGPTARDFLHV